MREIKFNCWNNHWKEMYAWEVMCDDGLNNYMTEDDIWLQYTGLKDKEGREIYEGDIIYHHEYIIAPGAVVQWDDTDACWSVGLGWPWADFYDDGKAEVEVVGNKFENPELLEQ